MAIHNFKIEKQRNLIGIKRMPAVIFYFVFLILIWGIIIAEVGSSLNSNTKIYDFQKEGIIVCPDTVNKNNWLGKILHSDITFFEGEMPSQYFGNQVSNFFTFFIHAWEV